MNLDKIYIKYTIILIPSEDVKLWCYFSLKLILSKADSLLLIIQWISSILKIIMKFSNIIVHSLSAFALNNNLIRKFSNYRLQLAKHLILLIKLYVKTKGKFQWFINVNKRWLHCI